MKRILPFILCISFISKSFGADSSKFHFPDWKKFYNHFFDQNDIRKNVIRVNFSNRMFMDPRSYTLGYERVTKPYQSFSVNLGVLYFPDMSFSHNGAINYDIHTQRSNGYLITVDYRFYLKKENLHKAPRGVYLAPFFSYFNQDTKILLDVWDQPRITKTTDAINLDLNAYNLGGLLGYQFVIGNRFALDLMLFGPSYTLYSIKGNIEGNFNSDAENDAGQAFLNRLKSKYPWVNQILENKTFQANKRVNLNSMNFRFGVQFGYVF